MKRLHCPACGYVCEVPQDSADDRAIVCSDCHFLYHVGDGAIWDMTVLRAVGHVAKLVEEIAAESAHVHLDKLKSAVAKGLLEVGWLRTRVRPATQLNDAHAAVEKVMGGKTA